MLAEWGLVGEKGSRKRREMFCDKLGIGYSNARALIKKLNLYEIDLREIKAVLSKMECRV